MKSSTESGVTLYSGSVIVIIETPPRMVSSKRYEVAEVVAVVLNVGFADTDTFTVETKSDVSRYSSTADIAAQSSYTQLPLGNAGSFRREVVAVAPEGLIGRSFQCRITKEIPASGEFDYYGLDFKIMPRPELTGEFFSRSGDIAAGWL